MIERLFVLAFFSSPLFRYVAVSVALLIFGYGKGRSDCAVKQAEKRAEEMSDWAEHVSEATAAAHEAALEVERKALENENLRNEISRLAAKEPIANNECVSDGTVERLHELRRSAPADPAR